MDKIVDQFITPLSKNRFFIISATTLGIFIFFLYFPTLSWLVTLWSTERSSVHGFFIPFISLYILWVKKEELKSLSPSPAYFSGAIILATAAFLLVIGRVGAFIHAEMISFVIILPGLTLFFLGREFLKTMGFSLFCLQFMIPWVQPVLEQIHLPFQLVTAVMASACLRLLGFPIFQEGIFVQLPTFTMEVAPECSGITYLTSVIAIGIPVAYLSQKTWLRGAVVILSGVFAMFIANWIRVTIAGLMGIYYGVDQLHGPGHILRGWVVAQVGWIVLFFVNWKVGKMPFASKYTLRDKWKENVPPISVFRSGQPALYPFFGVTIFLACLFAYLNGFGIPTPVPLKQPLDQFPKQIGVWYGKESDWVDGKKYYPGASQELTRTYITPDGKEICLYIAYFSTQREEKRLISYYSTPLHVRSQKTSLDMGIPLSTSVNISSIVGKGDPFDIYFWYKFPGKELGGKYEAKLQTISDALLHQRNNGAVIIVGTRKLSKTVPTEKKDLQNFIQRVSADLSINRTISS